MIELHYEDTEILDLDPEFFVLWLGKLCKMHNKKLGEISVIFTSDEYLLEMNRKHLGHDYYTDIITFNYNEGAKINGDLFISVERVKENAEQYNSDFLQELRRVIAHGTLHLLGFNDKSSEEEREMRQREEDALNLIVPRET